MIVQKVLGLESGPLGKSLLSIGHMGVSKNRGGPPKLSILIGFSIINHPFWGTPIFGNTHIHLQMVDLPLSLVSGRVADQLFLVLESC